jgi:hypothetical protein
LVAASFLPSAGFLRQVLSDYACFLDEAVADYGTAANGISMHCC